MVTAPATNPLVGLPFPRTGKRGVPQQFPRRLFEMLDKETNPTGATTTAHLISWSESGKAFRIFNVKEFANSVLPKYFRTKKFSSFQRNLNLYGFTKIRRGIDTDMYAHPSFCKDQPQALLQLRKIDNGSSSRSTTTPRAKQTKARRTTKTNDNNSAPIQFPGGCFDGSLSTHAPPPQVSPVASSHNDMFMRMPPTYSDDRGKLDLLAFALEHEFSMQQQQQV